MLSALTDVLRERKLLDADEEPGYTITLVSAHIANVAAHTRSGSWFHVRVKEIDSQPDEYDNCLRAWQAFPLHAPEPLERCFRDGWEIIVTRGIEHCPVRAGAVATNERGLAGEIVAFLEAARHGAAVAHPAEPHRAFLRGLRQRETDPDCAAILDQWLADGALDGLPHIRQHGDFVTNNLGLTGSSLVVFDWEDYGRIEFPGLDLCTLLASDAGFDAAALRAIASGGTRGPRSYAELVERGCVAAGLTPELYRRLIPLYLVIFLALKREYGKSIGAIVANLIHSLRHSPGADLGLGRA